LQALRSRTAVGTNLLEIDRWAETIAITSDGVEIMTLPQ